MIVTAVVPNVARASAVAGASESFGVNITGAPHTPSVQISPAQKLATNASGNNSPRANTTWFRVGKPVFTAIDAAVP